MTAPAQAVRRRIVFYVAGFDPKGPAFYHDNYRREAPLQARVGGMTIEVGQRERRGRYRAVWTVKATEEGNPVETEFVFLRWDDIVRQNWPRGSFRLFATMLSTYWQHIRSGFLLRTYATAWPTALAGAYPALFLILAVLLGAAVGALAGLLLAPLLDLSAWIALPAALAGAFAAIPISSPLLDRVFGIHWLIRIYTFALAHARREVEGLEERFFDFGRDLAAAARAGQADEILLIGHSTGAQAACSILGKALALDPDLGRRGPTVSFLTLGGSIPMLSWQPEAGWFREELQRIADCSDIDWIDFTIAQDGACFALHDPIASSGLVHPAGREPRPKLLNVRLFELYSPERFKRVHRQWFTIHFQYLEAGEQKADYDYFAITAGARRLGERYAHRASARDFRRFRSRLFGHLADRLLHPVA
jgi:hypothetical protein